MSQLLRLILNMSLSAGWIVLCILLLRPFLRKAPRWLHCLLWAPVALRLLIPAFPESRFSFLPSAKVLPEITGETPIVQTGITALNDAVNPVLTQVSPADFSLALDILLWFWAAGVILLAIVGIVSYLRLLWQVRISVKTEKGVYLCDDIDTPFILGVFRPRIYLPSFLSENAIAYVLAHERAHLHRRDHWWKPLGYVLLCIHWFNPLLWVAYVFLCSDIEKACDQQVIRNMDGKEKRSYSETLLACSNQTRSILVCPVAFGEVSVKTRIRGILNYKKPTLWVLIGAVAVSIFCSGSFLTNPLPCEHDYGAVCTREATCTKEGVMTYTCKDCWDRYKDTVPVIEHTLGENVVSKAATCAEEGILSAACTVCGKSFETGRLSKTEVHTMALQSRTPATCTANGQELHACTVCGITETKVLPAMGHRLYEGPGLASTCLTRGNKVILCENCGYMDVEILPAAGHSFESWGVGWEICTGCGFRRPANWKSPLDISP